MTNWPFGLLLVQKLHGLRVMTRPIRLPAVFFVCLLYSGFAATAHAQATPTQTQFGVRAGVSGDPDQFFLGAHLETRPIFSKVTFRPNLEVGFGDNQTVTAINIEFVYSIPLKEHPWRVYFGGGPAAVIRHMDHGDTDFGPGFNFLIGMQHRGGFFGEIKLGAIDSPEFKFAVGYACR